MTRAQAALHNHDYCLRSGRYAAARSWWAEFVRLGGLGSRATQTEARAMGRN